MATWTLKRDTGLSGGLSSQAACDGSNIYFRDTADDIYKYDPSTDTLTQISNAASWGSYSLSAQFQLQWVNGALYAVGIDGSDFVRIFQYSSGTTWTTAFTTSSGGHSVVALLGDGATLVLVTQTSGPTVYHAFYSPSWTEVTTLPSPWTVLSPFGGSAATGSSDFGIFIDTTQGGDEAGVLQFTGGAWVEADDWGTGVDRLERIQGDGIWCLQDGNLRFTDDFVTYHTPSDLNVTSVPAYNSIRSIGSRILTGTLTTYIFDSVDTWTSDGTIASVNNFYCYFRLNNGETYVLIEKSGTTQIFERDELLDAPTPIEFWHGQIGSHAKTSDLLFALDNPNCLALSFYQHAVIGRNEAGSPMVQRSDDYISWINVTSPFSSIITALQYVSPCNFPGNVDGRIPIATDDGDLVYLDAPNPGSVFIGGDDNIPQWIDPVTGGVFVIDGSGNLQWLEPGTEGQVLTMESGSPVWADSASGVTDHGALTGLADDDHPQYWNDTRGDAKIATHTADEDAHHIWPIGLGDLSNVDLTGLNTNDIIYFDGVNWIADGHDHVLDDQGDVTIVAVANNQILRYNSTSAQWENVNSLTTLESSVSSHLANTSNPHSVTLAQVSGAPNNAQYLVLTANATLTVERVFTPGAGFLATDSGAGAAYTVQLDIPAICAGRLTLTSNTPVTTADVTGATTIYFTPYKGNHVALYNGSTGWRLWEFTERSLALGTLISGRPYDVFIYDNSGTLTLELTAWTNTSTRATALVMQDGVYVRSGATTRRYLGTFLTTATTTTEDSVSKGYLWNYYNRVPFAVAYDTGFSSHTYGSTTWRYWNNSSAHKVEFIVGLVEEKFIANGGAYFKIDNNAYIANSRAELNNGGSPGTASQFVAFSSGVTDSVISSYTSAFLPALGYNDVSLVQRVNNALGTGTFGQAGFAFSRRK